jgi:hypothetical protein
MQDVDLQFVHTTPIVLVLNLRTEHMRQSSFLQPTSRRN